MVGNTIIIIILFAVGFQVIWHAVKADKQHKEIQERLQRIEDKLSGKGSE